MFHLYENIELFTNDNASPCPITRWRSSCHTECHCSMFYYSVTSKPFLWATVGMGLALKDDHFITHQLMF